MSKTLSRCLIVGGGRIALSHIPHLIDHPLSDVIGIVEPNWLLRFVLRRLFRLRVFRSLEVIEPSMFDCAFVLTPPNSHFSITKRLLRDHKHVFLEKPMTLDPDDSANLLSLAKSNNVQLSCGYVYRHHPIFKEVKRLVSSEVYGLPVACQISMRGNVISSDSITSWRNSGKGSGCLYDYGCHVIDLSVFLFGKPGTVSCLSKEELYQPGVIDRFSAKLDHINFSNVTSYITCDWADETVRKAGLELEIKTQNHSIYTDGQTIKISGETVKSYSIKDVDTDVEFYLRGEEFQNQTNAFFMAIANHQLVYSDIEDAVSVDETLLEIYEQVL